MAHLVLLNAISRVYGDTCMKCPGSILLSAGI